jgi:hypothetical protein
MVIWVSRVRVRWICGGDDVSGERLSGGDLLGKNRTRQPPPGGVKV